MPNIKEVKPGYEDQPYVASYYFYSEYDSTKHFEYNIPFMNNGIDIDAVQLEKNRKKAFVEAIEYHFSFEQVLPREDDDYVKFYRPISLDIDQSIFQEGKSNYENITLKTFEDTIVASQLELLPTKTVTISGVNGLAIDPTTTEQYTPYSRYIGQWDYSEMSILDLEELYETWTENQGTKYYDATQWNKYCYENALFCQVKRPTKNNDAELYVSPYEFRKTLRLVNSVFNFKIPVEEGWYVYSKQKKKWEYINFKEQVVNNNG